MRTKYYRITNCTILEEYLKRDFTEYIGKYKAKIINKIFRKKVEKPIKMKTKNKIQIVDGFWIIGQLRIFKKSRYKHHMFFNTNKGDLEEIIKLLIKKERKEKKRKHDNRRGIPINVGRK